MLNGRATPLLAILRGTFQGRHSSVISRSLRAMRGISNLRRVGRVLLFELQDIRYIASYRSKVREEPELSLSMADADHSTGSALKPPDGRRRPWRLSCRRLRLHLLPRSSCNHTSNILRSMMMSFGQNFSPTFFLMSPTLQAQQMRLFVTWPAPTAAKSCR